MKDGTAEFKTVDARVAAIFDLIYPVGSVFATTGSAPNLGTWEEIAQGRTLQGADSSHTAGSTVEAGLPNIEGIINNIMWLDDKNVGGCFYSIADYSTQSAAGAGMNSGGMLIGFNAFNHNPIYGNSTTVQPPAYIVHFYRRIA